MVGYSLAIACLALNKACTNHAIKVCFPFGRYAMSVTISKKVLTRKEKKKRYMIEYRKQNAEAIRVQREGWRREHGMQLRANNHVAYHSHPEVWVIPNLRARAKRLGVPFDLDYDDVKAPAVCPVLGIPLVRNHQGSKVGPNANSPTVDRLIPEKGYVKGNIAVISHKANAIKQDATADEVFAVAKWMKEQGL